MLDVVRLTYAELARARGVTVATARRMAARYKWAKSLGNDGLARVAVPETALRATLAVDTAPDSAAMTALEAAMRALRGERDAERERADRAERAAGVLRAKLVAARYAREVEVADLRRRLDRAERRAAKRWWHWR